MGTTSHSSTSSGTLLIGYRRLLFLKHNMKEGLSAQDHAASLLANMNLQRKQVQFCDCVIRKGHGQVYSVHRCILAASSPVLASILSSTSALVELEAPCLDDPILGFLFDYIYTGTLPHLENKHYSHLLAAAKYLEMDELLNALRTNVLEYHNTSGISEGTISTKLTLLKPKIDCYVNDAKSPHSGYQIDSPGMHLSCYAEDDTISRMDGVCMGSGTDAHLRDTNINTSEMTEHSFCIPKIDQISHNLIQSSGCSGRTQQMSTYIAKDRTAGAIKQEQENKKEGLGSMEEDDNRLYSSNLAEMQKNEHIRVQNMNLYSRSKVKADEMQSDPREVKNNHSHCCSTSVIRHTSNATRKHAAEPPHYTGLHTVKDTLAEAPFCKDIAKNVKAQNQHYARQVSDRSVISCHIPNQETNSSSTNLLENNGQTDKEHSNDTFYYFDSGDESKKAVPSKSDHSFEDLSLVKDKTQVQSVTEEKSDPRIKFNGLCAKSNLNEENQIGCNNSAKNVYHCNRYRTETDLINSTAATTTKLDNATDSSSVYKGLDDKNTWSNQNQKLLRSLSIPPEGNTCQAAFSDPTYNGHLYYHWESHAGTDRPTHIEFSPNLHLTSDVSSNSSYGTNEDNDVSNLCDSSTTLSNGQLLMQNIGTTSAEILVSYKHTFEIERMCGFKNENMMKNDDGSLDTAVSQISEVDGTLESSRGKQGETILTSSSTSCTFDCAKDCTQNSMSSALSDHIPSSSIQTNQSDHLSSPAHHAFQCSMCERSFSQRGSLNRHMRSHLGVRPFPCPQCPMTFSRQYRVTEHMRVHQRSALGTDFPKPPASSV